MPRFIELCINSGRNRKIVAEIDLTEMKTDAEVFSAIAGTYRQSRKGRGCVAVKLPQLLERYVNIPLFECYFVRPSDIIFRKVRQLSNAATRKRPLILRSSSSISINVPRSPSAILAYLQNVKSAGDDTTINPVPWTWTRSCLLTISSISWTTPFPTQATLGCSDYPRSYVKVS